MTPFRWILLTLLVVAGAVWAGAALVSWHYAPRPNYDWIMEGLTIGGAVKTPPPGTRAVINLNESEDGYSAEVAIFEPIRDGRPTPDLAWLRRMVAAVDEQLSAGRPLYIHCQNGVSRTGMLTTAYFMWKRGWSRDEALAWLRERRPGLNPNPVFGELLEQWEAELRAADAAAQSM